MRPAPIFPRSLLTHCAACLSRITSAQLLRRKSIVAVIFATALQEIMATLFIASPKVLSLIPFASLAYTHQMAK
jgi:hypothetical protein